MLNVKLTKEEHPYKCYSLTTYEVTADHLLDSTEIKNLRDSGKFGYGQCVGMQMGTHKVIDGVYTYMFQTTCDSGD